MSSQHDEENTDDNLDKSVEYIDDVWTLKLIKNVLRSEDLEVDVESKVSKIDIKCEILQIDRDFPTIFRGRNVIINADTIDVLEESILDVSGKDADNNFIADASCNAYGLGNNGKNGYPGERGGNCYINYKNIKKSNLLTIISNGGNGSNGHDGGNGRDGSNGNNVQFKDLTYEGSQINISTFCQLTNKSDKSTTLGPQNLCIVENGMEKRFIFDDKKFELLVLVKGVKGEKGKVGGFGGFGGDGGKPGKIKAKKLKLIGKIGQIGEKGSHGFNGKDGMDGGDAFMIVRNDKAQPTYGGLDSRKKYELLTSSIKINDNSVYYEPINQYFYISEIKENFESVETPLNLQIASLNDYEICFVDALISVLKNANHMYFEVTKRLKLKQFLKDNIKLSFFKIIMKNSFDIPEYDSLKYYTETLMVNNVDFKDKILDILREYVEPSEMSPTDSETYYVKGKVLTTEIFKILKTIDFTRLDIICDIFHVRSDLPSKFRGKTVVILANTIHVHCQVEWNLSGLDKTSNWEGPARRESKGANGANGQNGGTFEIVCKKIINASLWTVISNGGNGSNGQNGGSGRDAVDGKDPSERDFTMNGNEINLESLKKIIQKKIWIESGMVKSIYIESDEAYLMLVKGTKGKKPQPGQPGGSRGYGGIAGKITIKTDTNEEQHEIKKIAINGHDGVDGCPGVAGKFSFRDGCGAFLYVRDGNNTFFGIGSGLYYEIIHSEVKYEYSVMVGGIYYYPKVTHFAQYMNSVLDDVTIGINLISVLRNAYNQFDIVVQVLQLESFSKNEISFEDFVSVIRDSNPQVQHFTTLKEITSGYEKEACSLHEYMRAIFSEFIKAINITKSSDVITIRKKILMSSEFCDLKFDKDIKEFHIVCDTLHINSDLPDIFHGKNLAIFSNFVFVQKECVWDLSGCSVKENILDAEQDENGKGINGKDGLAGKSGGNFQLECKFIENFSLLKVTTNGSDGGKGQNGGNGRNGNNGQDAEDSDFKIGGIELSVSMAKATFDYLENEYKKEPESFKIDYKSSTDKEIIFYSGKYKSDNGLKGDFFFDCNNCIVLVHGGDGENGTLGGVGGYGGDAGYPGEISFKCENLDKSLIIINGDSGKAGERGQNGWNGFHGRVGGDIHKFQSIKMNSTFVDGIDCLTKFKITELPYEGIINSMLATFTSSNIQEHKIDNKEKKCYTKVIKDKDIKIVANEKHRNDSVLTRSKFAHAIANKNELIDIDAIKNENSKYLNDAMSEISNEITEQEQIAMTVGKSTENAAPTKNPEIDMESIMKEHSYYLETDIRKVLESSTSSHELQLTNKQSQNLSDKIQISEKRILSFDFKSTNKHYNKPKKLLNIKEEISFENLRNKDIKKSVKDCLDFLKSSKLSEDQYKYLIENIGSFGIEECNPNENISSSTSESGTVSSKGMSLSDIIDLCKEKYTSLIYYKIYKTFSEIKVDYARKSEPFYLKCPHFSKKISCLKDTKRFVTSSNQFDKHFTTNGWEEIFNYFKKNYTDHNSSIAESIFNYLIKLKKCTNTVSGQLNSFYVRAGSFDRHNKNVKNESSKKDEFLKILFDFYDNKIKFFIKSELKTLGIRSAIYRKILAHKYGFKIAFCKRSLSGDIKVAEKHNYRDELRFEYSKNEVDYDEDKIKNKDADSTVKNHANVHSDQNEQMQELFILFDNNNFSILEYRGTNFEMYKYKQAADENFRQVALILENFSTKGPEIISTSFQDDKFQNLLKDVFTKLELSGFKFSDILKNPINENAVYEAVISTFSKNFYTLENEKVIIYEIKNDVKIEDSKKYIEKDESYERARIKILFGLITKIGGSSILNAIGIKLNNCENVYNLHEFSTFLYSIFMILWREEDFVVPLTFMILGLEQKLWIPELVIIKTFRMYGTSRKWKNTKWEAILCNNQLNHVACILLEKIINIDEVNDNKCIDLHEFDEICNNLIYFDDSICEILENTNLRLWSTITTDLYWDIQLDQLTNYDQSIRIKLKTILEDINNKYGIKTRKLLEHFVNRRKELNTFDILKFTGNFTNGKWLFDEEILTILNNNSPKKWTESLNNYFVTAQGMRSLDNIINLVKKSDETSINIKYELEDIKYQIKKIRKIIKKHKKKNLKELREIAKSSEDFSEILAAVTRAIKLIANVKLRDTQLISILTMHHSISGVLLQVSTGEGKTLIGVAYAILKGLLGEKVDIVTSSSVLAKRDATNKINNQIFSLFDITVDHNCYENKNKRREAYKCKVVYGTLSNFQRDYLITEFHEEKVMLSHHFENILVDEVDSMLLDKGNNILYLSQDLPDMDEIENIFILIWQWLNQQFCDFEHLSAIRDVKIIRNVVLDNIYGILNESVIEDMQKNVDSKKIIREMKKLQIIDEENLIVAKNVYKIKLRKWNGYTEDLADKILNYCLNKINKENHLQIPKHLKPFVLRHLNDWIESGIKALYLQNEKEYIIDTPKSAHIKYDPNVNIIDLDTGTDMGDSQWDKGLHQFLQIKYGCKVSPMSLKSVFISNVSFFKLYKKRCGMTGTLGSLQERKKITKIHDIDYVTIPRHVSRNFREFIPLVKSTSEEWIKCIHEEVDKMIGNNRSVLIICKTIQETQAIQKEIKSSIPTENVLLYQRDSDSFELNTNELQPGYVIVSTNLAGRGTDIKLTKQLADNGGLHVILTNLPDNSRIEEQALGRAARSGEKGTGRIIIWSPTSESISKLKEVRNKNEFRRLDEIGEYYKNFIKTEEKFFKKFQSEYKMLKNTQKNSKSAYLLNFVIQWAFWLDQNSKLLDDWKNVDNILKLQESFDKFIIGKKTLHPVMKIELSKEADKKLKLVDDEDLLAFQYLKIYEMLKSKKERRELTDEELCQIKKCLRMIQSCINSRHIKIQMVKYFKLNSYENQPPTDGYVNQQREIIENYKELFKSLKALMGEDINPEMLASAVINTSVMQNQLYEELINKDRIESPQINSVYSEEDLRIVCRLNNLHFDKTKEFLKKIKIPELKSLKKFESKLMEEFNLPTRLKFWTILNNKGILKDEIVYGIIDMNVIKNVDPSAGEFINANLLNEFDEFANNSNGKSIYFASFTKNSNEDNKFVVKYNDLKAHFRNTRLNFLKYHNVIEVNMKAIFDTEVLTALEKTNIFDEFDRITENCMEDVCQNHQKIIEKLIDLNILTTAQDEKIYFLINENLKKFSDPYFLEDYFMYQKKVEAFLEHKFAYIIALENLINDFNTKENPVIQLEINPYANLMNDLFDNFIINQAKVRQLQEKEYKKLFENVGPIKILKPVDISVDADFQNELRNKGVISSENNIMKFDKDKIKFSEKYQNDQSTILLLFDNQRKLLEEVNNVEKCLKNWRKPFHDFESNAIILKPINEILPENNYTNFMKTKGLGSVIKIQKNSSFTFWMRFSQVLAIAAVEVFVSLLIFWLNASNPYGKILAGTFAREAIHDMKFAMSKLKTGYFTWKDFAIHKSKIIMVAVVKFVNETGFSNQRWLKSMITSFEKQATNEFENEEYQMINSCKTAIIKSESCAGLYILINEFAGNLTTTIMNDVSENLQQEYMEHKLKDIFKKALNYMKEGELKELIEDEFPEVQKLFDEIKKLKNQVSNIFEDIVNMRINSEDSMKASIKLITNAVSVKDSVKKILNHIEVTLKDFLARKTENDKINEDNPENNDKFNDLMMEHLNSMAKAQCQNILNTYVIKPAITRADHTIKDKSSKDIENIIRGSMDKNRNSKSKQNAIKLYNGMDAVIDLYDIPVDLIKQTMHIHSRVNNYKQFRKLMQTNLPYDEICVESIRESLEAKLNKNFMIRIIKNGNKYEFGDAGCKKTNTIDIMYSKEHICSVISEKCPELKYDMNYNDIFSNIEELTNTRNDITKALKSFDNGFYKDFRSIDIHKCILESGIEYGSYDDLKPEFLDEKQLNVVVVHVPGDTTYDSLIDKDGNKIQTTCGEKPAIVLPEAVYKSTAFNTNMMRTFEERQRSFILNNELEKAIAMQFIDQHNATVILRKKNGRFREFIHKLHSNQKSLVEFCLEKGFLNEEKEQFLQNIVIDLRLSRIEKVKNQYILYP